MLPVTQTHAETGGLPTTVVPVAPEEDKGLVEQVITWASVLYAAGFFIVLLHTWRLGLPVLDLVQAVYVWIGIPLAVCAYFANQPWRYLRSRVEAESVVLRNSLRSSPLPESELITKVIERVAPLFLSDFLTLQLFNIVMSQLRPQFSVDSKLGKAALRLLHLGLRLRAGISAAFTLVTLAIGAAIVAGILVAYVWIVYPRLPQSLGGGAPARVRLVLDVTKVSPDFSKVAGLGASWSKDGPPFLTSELTLLYKTADGFWLSSSGGGAPFLLDKSMVLSLMYSDSSGRTGP